MFVNGGGGGVVALMCNVTITDSRIVNNSSLNFGGGVCSLNGWLTMERCTVNGNGAGISLSAPAIGGGVCVISIDGAGFPAPS